VLLTGDSEMLGALLLNERRLVMEQIPSHVPEYPKRETETNADVLHDYAKHAADVFPGLGAIVERHIMPPLARRRLAWADEVAAAVNAHAKELNRLKDNPIAQDRFLSMFIRASQGALSTHEQEKRVMFGNALKNSLLSPEDFDKHAFFLRLLEDFQVLHVKVLSVFAGPAAAVEAVYSKHDPGKRPPDLTGIARLYLGGGLERLIDLAVRDLQNASLIDPEATQTVDALRMQLVGSATQFGHDFLAYISG